MAEEAQVPEYNGNAEPEIIPVQITDIIDQMDTPVLCETRECDSVFICTEETGVLLEDKGVTSVLDTNTEKSVEEQKGEADVVLLSQAEPEAQKEGECGECETILETDADALPAYTEDVNDEETEHEGVKTESPDPLLCNQTKSEAVEDPLTEEENASIETDNENGEGSLDEQEYELRSFSPGDGHREPSEEQSVSGKRPDISRHSYSRYDTVSYRKIRRGNTKQRIDEFESMMNL